MTTMQDLKFEKAHLNILAEARAHGFGKATPDKEIAYADTLSGNVSLSDAVIPEPTNSKPNDTPTETHPCAKGINSLNEPSTEEMSDVTDDEECAEATQIAARSDIESEPEKSFSVCPPNTRHKLKTSHHKPKLESVHVTALSAVSSPLGPIANYAMSRPIHDETETAKLPDRSHATLNVDEITKTAENVDGGMPTMPFSLQNHKVNGTKLLPANEAHLNSDEMTPCFLNDMHEVARRQHHAENHRDASFDVVSALEDEDRHEEQRLNSSELSIGHVVGGRYEILSEVARGGFGIVYRARQIGIDRIVALKRLKSQNEPSAVQRFLLEANIIKNLIHPNTIQLIDAGTDRDNHLYFVMEYIEGQSLQAILNHGECISLQRAINITIQILKSLNEAHQRGIIHRDLKPSNILLRNVIGEHDFVKVLDFGIAKQTSMLTPKLTMDGKILGTPQYIAPELFSGQTPTPASDLYAIGLILATMIMGTSLVPENPMEAIKWHMTPTPSVLPNWISASPIGPFLQKAIQKDPEKRYQTALEMIVDLKKLEAQQAGQETYLNPMPRPGMTSLQILILVSVIVIMLGIVGILAYLVLA